MPSSGYIGDDERTKIFYPIRNSKSFDYKTKLVGNLRAGNNAELEDIKIIVPLKNLSTFMFNVDILLINAEIELILKWSEDYILTERVMRGRKEAEVGPPVLAVVLPVNTPSHLKFNITDCELYVPVVTLQTEYQNLLYKHLKSGISIDFIWSK